MRLNVLVLIVLLAPTLANAQVMQKHVTEASDMADRGMRAVHERMDGAGH